MQNANYAFYFAAIPPANETGSSFNSSGNRFKNFSYIDFYDKAFFQNIYVGSTRVFILVVN